MVKKAKRSRKKAFPAPTGQGSAGTALASRPRSKIGEKSRNMKALLREIPSLLSKPSSEVRRVYRERFGEDISDYTVLAAKGRIGSRGGRPSSVSSYRPRTYRKNALAAPALFKPAASSGSDPVNGNGEASCLNDEPGSKYSPAVRLLPGEAALNTVLDIIPDVLQLLQKVGRPTLARLVETLPE